MGWSNVIAYTTHEKSLTMDWDVRLEYINFLEQTIWKSIHDTDTGNYSLDMTQEIKINSRSMKLYQTSTLLHSQGDCQYTRDNREGEHISKLPI